MANLQEADLRALFVNDTPLMDVRAPVEFAAGSLPGAINLPIMNNEERAQVGTTYKQAGREVAITLGHELVSGDVKERRVQGWMAQIRQQPETVLYCFRGGLRSQITQRWLKEAGVDRPLIVGGFKAARQYLLREIEQFSQQEKFLVITGPTGSAKTQLLKNAAAFAPGLDLEAMAHHRGSAFGAWEIPQPTQIDFENRIAVGLMKLKTQFPQGPTLFEDESRMIGQRVVPESLFVKMRASPVLYVDESFATRVENIFQDYVVRSAIGRGSEAEALQVFASFTKATQAISRKLGGLRTQEVLQDIAISREDYLSGRGLEANKAWIGKLLQYYYDPLYLSSLEKRQPSTLFRGSAAAILDYLRNLRAGC